ncbi:hypothetical protein A8C32_13830 [Flavivirga aquatica]|uniref:FecR protein domain-containing protein n=1 Tax=Flavivirga aquatica TaxID=1849968 RepID=A0A1E5TCA5_9FLAO|nr:FecR family protein [Flavivirga aquatica]OEK08979.1 hypothetical protein A8C32_13830 [Flavivirga aquatica]
MENTKNNNIDKYLSFELSSEEEKKFKNSLEYKKHQEVLELFENTKAIPFNEDLILEKINTNKSKVSKNNTKVIPLYKKWLPASIAASILLLISVSIFYFNSINQIEYATISGQSIQFSLPDASTVWLNAKSEISHNKDWNKSRDIELNGEAYFEVAKGKTFTVKTPQGIVAVLGTKFNVKQRDNFFEVHCYEGTVSVIHKGKKTILKANDFFNSKLLNKRKKSITKPNWIENKSIFRNTPIDEVITDISIQYNVEVVLEKGINKKQLEYTGSYDYSDPLETVITVLCKSLNLNYSIEDKHIYLRPKK